MQKAIIVCADDYGLSPAVSLGIRELLEERRLSATSVMMTSPFAEQEILSLKILKNQADLGVHLTLTDQKPLTTLMAAKYPLFPSLTKLMLLAFTRQLPLQAIAKELEAQIQLFIDIMEQPPDFLDGHHHIHLLPGIRDIVLALYQRYVPKGYVRSCYEPVRYLFKRNMAWPKTWFISQFLAVPQRKQLAKTGIACNQGFSGVYGHTGDVNLPCVFDTFIRHARAQSLIMTHPGYVDQALRNCDPLTDLRRQELNYLKSEEFAKTLLRHKATVKRFCP